MRFNPTLYTRPGGRGLACQRRRRAWGHWLRPAATPRRAPDCSLACHVLRPARAADCTHLGYQAATWVRPSQSAAWPWRAEAAQAASVRLVSQVSSTVRSHWLTLRTLSRIRKSWVQTTCNLPAKTAAGSREVSSKMCNISSQCRLQATGICKPSRSNIVNNIGLEDAVAQGAHSRKCYKSLA